MSALCTTGVLVVDESLPAAGSLTAEDTDAVLTTGPPPEYDAGTRYVDVIVRVAPAGTVRSEHGNAVVQSPVLPTKLTPAGVGSATTTDVASDGPLFVTVVV